MDRGHPELAGRIDALHPAVLKLVAAAASAGAAAGKTVAVCGGAAADRLAVPILLGLGVSELSVVPAPSLPSSARSRSLRISDCRELAHALPRSCLTRSGARLGGADHRTPGRFTTMNLRLRWIAATGTGTDAAHCGFAHRRAAAALGQPDLLGWGAMAAAGDAIFTNLGLLFAVGVGVGLARENHGAAGLAALVGFLVTTRAVETLLAAPHGSLANSAFRSGCCPASLPASATTGSATSRCRAI